MVKKVLITIFSVLLCISCNDGMYDTLSRNTDDPFTEKPKAVSFVTTNAVYLSWSSDDCADEYILERAENLQSLVYKEIYRGTRTSYDDFGLSNDIMYLYRLSKRRGNKTFGPSDPVLGVSSTVARDIYEPNDTIENATLLTSRAPYIANMYYYQSYNGISIGDEDWYCVDVPPLLCADILVNDSQTENNKDPSHFMVSYPNRSSEQVDHLVSFKVENTESETARLYFKLYPNNSKFISQLPGSSGGKVVKYTISVTGMQAF